MNVGFEKIDRLSPMQRPDQRVAGYQRWSDLLFLHWRISPAEMARHLPDSVDIDTFDGGAWVGLVAFRMSGVRPWWSPPIPGVSSFPETNVRTYVHRKGDGPGVWFLSLDAASSLGVRLGRWKWKLAYHRSRMHVRRRGTRASYFCERLWPGKMGVGGTIEAEVGDLIGGLDAHVEPGRAIPGTLEHFLIERYLLYTERNGQLLRGQVHHAPYPLHEAHLIASTETFLGDLGFNIDRPPDHCVFSAGVTTEIFPLQLL